MTIRTISQLPSCGEDTDLNAFIEVSVPRTDEDPETPTGYVSKKQSFENIRNKLEGEIKTSLIDRFKLQDSDASDIDVKSIKDRVTTLESGAITITGEKKFASTPIIENYEGQYGGSDADKKLVTLGYVRNTVIPGITYDRISPTSKYIAARGETGFINDGNLLKWSIDSGKQVSNTVELDQTGNLVMYGILADNGNVDGRTAWVGLYGIIDGTNILISLQPWVIGQKSTIMQYVSFNLPVKSGLKLQIRTGFPVDGTNSMSQGSNSAMYGLNTVNSFVGYVIS